MPIADYPPIFSSVNSLSKIYLGVKKFKINLEIRLTTVCPN